MHAGFRQVISPWKLGNTGVSVTTAPTTASDLAPIADKAQAVTGPGSQPGQTVAVDANGNFVQRALAGDELARYQLGWAWTSASLALLGAAVSGYHGYKRNRGSIGWGLAWGALGLAFPVITTGVGLVQGLAQPKGR